MPDDSDPPRKFYDLKPKEFERVNAPPRSVAPVTEGSAQSPAATDKIDVRDLIRRGMEGVPLLSANGTANRANEVHTIQRDNLARANEAGLNRVTPRKKPSRRRRDYIVTMIVGNTFFIGGLFVVPIFAAVGIIMFNICITWIMWFVMDDY